jgi:hypothetical protein
VSYKLTHIEELIKNLINLTNETIENAIRQKFFQHKRECFYCHLHSCLTSHIVAILPILKHSSYEEEHEYRLSAFEFANEKLNELFEIQIPDEKRIWSENNILLPFRNTISRTISDQFNHDCIAEIWIGPGLNFEHAKHEITELLNKNGYENVQIKKSDIPYRPKK